MAIVEIQDRWLHEYKEKNPDKADPSHRTMELYVMNYDGSDKKIIRYEERDESITINASWSSDSKQIVYNFENNLYIVDIENMSQTKITSEEKQYKNPSWSYDGKKIIYAVDDKEIWMITL